jgi:hypothetical protein
MCEAAAVGFFLLAPKIVFLVFTMAMEEFWLIDSCKRSHIVTAQQRRRQSTLVFDSENPERLWHLACLRCSFHPVLFSTFLGCLHIQSKE